MSIVTREWLQMELYELLSAKHGQGADEPALMVGLRGTDLVIFAPGGAQYVILVEEAR